MSQSIAIDSRAARRMRGRGHDLVLGAALGMVVGILGFAIVASAVDVVRAAFTHRTAAATAVRAPEPAPDLPREWSRWKIGAEVDHMYRQAPSPRLDWIRGGGRR